MSRRSCVIRVLPAPAISRARILPVRAGPGWRGGAAWAGWGRARGGALTDGRGRVLVVPGRGAAGSGMTLLPFREAGAVARPGHHCDSGRPGRAG
jgi:hypothetical protein